MYILINNLLLLNHQNVHFDPDLLIYWHCTATGNWKNSSEPKFRAKKKREEHEIKEHFFAAFVFLDILGKHFCYTISLYSAINSIILHDISNARISQTGMKKL